MTTNIIGSSPVLPIIETETDWKNLPKGKAKAELEEILLQYLKKSRWFGGKARSTKQASIPETLKELQVLLDAFLLEKAIYELLYELNNRPAWIKIPLQGILQLLTTNHS
jgi:predicted trehalose synthase